MAEKRAPKPEVYWVADREDGSIHQGVVVFGDAKTFILDIDRGEGEIKRVVIDPKELRDYETHSFVENRILKKKRVKSRPWYSTLEAAEARSLYNLRRGMLRTKSQVDCYTDIVKRRKEYLRDSRARLSKCKKAWDKARAKQLKKALSK